MHRSLTSHTRDQPVRGTADLRLRRGAPRRGARRATLGRARFVLILLAASAAPRHASAQYLMGRVVDAASGQPLPKAAVGVQVPGDSVVKTLTAKDGAFALQLPAAGTYVVHVQASRAPAVVSDSITVAADSVVQREFRVAMPPDPVFYEFQVDQTIRRLSSGVAPRYPQALRDRGVHEGSATLQYVVDTLGRVDSASLRVLRQTHPEFAANARAAALAQLFRPAERDGRKVRVLVELPFAFTVRMTNERIRTLEVGRPLGDPPGRVP